MSKKSRPTTPSAKPTAQPPEAIEILPALPQTPLPDPARPHPAPQPAPHIPTELMLDPDDLPPPFAFTPVPRKRNRANGLSALKQRTFIACLAGNGSVEMSAAAIGNSSNALYQLRKAEGAESFAAAWEVAIDMGSRRVLDLLMEHSIHGVPEKIYKDGELILERRKFNTRAMMWIVQQRFPEQFGGSLNISGRPDSSLPDGLKKLKEEWRKEWEEEAASQSAEAAAARDAELHSMEATLERLCQKYQAKVREEYFFRAEGNTIAADFALRQLTQIEVVMDVGGISLELIRERFHTAPHGGPWSTAISRAMEEARHTAWEQASGEEADWYDRDGAAGEAPDGPSPIRYTRPKLPYYLTEAELAADEAARARASTTPGDTWRTRLSREQEWQAARKTDSYDPSEEPTFLPRG